MRQILKNASLGFAGLIKSFAFFASIFAAIFIYGPAAAHHGTNGQFDTSSRVTLSGKITNIRFVNPHSYVYFDVTDEDGSVQNWRCELRAGSLLRRYGWSEDMFETGAPLTILGAPAWREPYGCLTHLIRFEDGQTVPARAIFDSEGAVEAPPRQLALENGRPNFSGNWLRDDYSATPRPRRWGADGLGDESIWEASPARPPLGREFSIEITPKAIAALDGLTNEDNPIYSCEPVNILHDWKFFDPHVNQIEMDEDKMIMRYGFMGLERIIHLNDRPRPKTVLPSRTGYSRGHWEGDILVVTTDNFAPGFLMVDTSGDGMLTHSAKLLVTERFEMSSDGDTLSRDYQATDPESFSGIYKGSDDAFFTHDTYEDYACEELTNEIVDGF